MADRETLDVYEEKAREYADNFGHDEPDPGLQRFIAALDDGARVLDLGCGTGQSTAFLQAAGFDASGMDASPAMAAIAKERFDIDVRIATFDELDATALYDGIYANFSLLHASKSDMPRHLTAVARALKSGGVFHIALKVGEGERRDALGRYYAYYQVEELTTLLDTAGFTTIDRSFGAEAGLAGDVSPYMILLARKR